MSTLAKKSEKSESEKSEKEYGEKIKSSENR